MSCLAEVLEGNEYNEGTILRELDKLRMLGAVDTSQFRVLALAIAEYCIDCYYYINMWDKHKFSLLNF